MRADSSSPLAKHDQLLTVAEVARRLSCSVRTCRTLVALRELPIVRIGARAIRISEADLAAFVASRRSAP